jgi:hypothetical protein
MIRTRAILSVLVWPLGLAFIASCGDVYADPDNGSPLVASSAVTDASANTPPVFPNDPQTVCPASRPRENTECNTFGSTCEFGTSADRQCNTALACVGENARGAWSRRPNDPCFSSTCPASGDTASLHGKPCTLEADGGVVTDADEAVCEMSDGLCACTTGPDGASRHDRTWVCVRPLAVCPQNRPLLGRTCTGSLWCDYGSCDFKRGLVMECRGGVWLTGGSSCE